MGHESLHIMKILSVQCLYTLSLSCPFSLYHPYIFYFLIRFLVSFFFYCTHARIYSHQVYNSNGGLAPKIGLVLGQSWIVIPMNKHSSSIPPM